MITWIESMMRDTARDRFLTANHSHLECGWELLAIQSDSNLLDLVPLLDHPAHQLSIESQFTDDHVSPRGSGKKKHYIIIGKSIKTSLSSIYIKHRSCLITVALSLSLSVELTLPGIVVPLIFIKMVAKGLDMRTTRGSAWNCCWHPRRRRFSCLKSESKIFKRNYDITYYYL